MHLYVHSFLLSVFIIFLIIKLRNYMVPGINKPQTLNYDKCQNITYIYIMYFLALLPVSKNLECFASMQQTCEANFIGSIIG